MQATIITLKGLPALVRRSAKALICGLWLRAVKVAMYKAFRANWRPPLAERLPLLVPESSGCGATPTRALISLPSREPISGVSAKSAALVAAPMPWALWRI